MTITNVIAIATIIVILYHSHLPNNHWVALISGFPIKTSIFRGFSIATFDCQRVAPSTTGGVAFVGYKFPTLVVVLNHHVHVPENVQKMFSWLLQLGISNGLDQTLCLLPKQWHTMTKWWSTLTTWWLNILRFQTNYSTLLVAKYAEQMTKPCQGTSNSDTCAPGQSDARSEGGAQHAAGLVPRWLSCSIDSHRCTECRFKKGN